MSRFIKIDLLNRGKSMVIKDWNIVRLEKTGREGVSVIELDADLSSNSYAYSREISDEEYERLTRLLTTEDEKETKGEE